MKTVAKQVPIHDTQSQKQVQQQANVPVSPDALGGHMAVAHQAGRRQHPNIIVSAAYLAASDGHCVSMDMLLHSTRRELQKMGRLVGEVDLNPG